MKTLFSLSTLLMLCFAAATVYGADKDGATLYWRDGNTLAGQIVSANQESVEWSSPMFVDPVRIDMTYLSAIRFPKSKSNETGNDSFRISMSNGDVLFGNLVAASEDSFQFQSDRLGSFSLARKKIENIKRVDTPDLIYQGPRGVDGWTRPDSKEALTDWRAQPNGSLVTDTGDRGIFRPLELPERCEIEFVVESQTKRPSFTFSLSSRRETSLRVESWDDVLVLLSGFRFTELGAMEKEQRRVHLHLFVDQSTNQVIVYSHAGEKLGELQDQRFAHNPDGIQIWNRDGDLQLKYVRVDRWNGEFPKPLIPGMSRTHLGDGSIAYGEVKAFAKNDDVVTIGEGDDQRDVRVEEITNIVIREDSQTAQEQAANQVIWQQGTVISGPIEKIQSDTVTIKPDYSDEPIVAVLTGVERIILPGTSPAPESPDQLTYSGGTLQGTLVIDGKTDAPIRWTPVGGLNASALASAGDAKFVRGAESAEVKIDSAEYPDILYLKNGDIIPCKFGAATEEHVELEIPFSDTTKISSSAVKAIEFSTPERVSQRGFADPNWRRLLGGPKIDAHSMTFKSSGGYGHADILTGDEVRFRLAWGPQQFSELQVQLYGQRLGNHRDSTNLKIMVNGQKIWVEEVSPAANQNQIQFQRLQVLGRRGADPAANRGTVVETESGVANVSLAARDGEVHVVVNGQLLRSIPMNDRVRRGKSLAFKATINAVTRNLPYGNNPLTKGLVISDFVVRNLDGTSVKQFIMEETRNRALLIPRFRRNRPSTHVALAPNGDLLRGKLKGIDSQRVRFESQLEEFRFDRERIAAVIWLHPPKSSDADPEEEPEQEVHEMQLRFGNGLSLSMTPSGVVDGELVGKASTLGTCRIPARAIQEVALGKDTSPVGMIAYSQWVSTFAPEPDWEQPESASDSPGMQLVGTVANDFELPAIDGSTFKLSDHQDKVVILDFWATWCGPCVAALPDYMEATSEFDPDEVLFAAVNLQESSQDVRKFLKEKGWDPVVPLDASGAVGADFFVSGIPHTVILSPGNIVENVHVGYRPDGGANLQNTIRQILDGTWERPTVESNDDAGSDNEPEDE